MHEVLIEAAVPDPVAGLEVLFPVVDNPQEPGVVVRPLPEAREQHDFQVAALNQAQEVRQVERFNRAWIYIPITRQNRGSELEVPLGHLPFHEPESIANVQAIGSLPSVRFEKRLGLVPEVDLKKVKAALDPYVALRSAYYDNREEAVRKARAAPTSDASR
jgi:mRNA-degrading endonuclease toxin of MazEF toxin-antitoxin module